MWLYKVRKQNNKTDYVLAIYFSKKEAEEAAKQAAFFDNYQHKFIVKRCRGDLGDILK